MSCPHVVYARCAAIAPRGFSLFLRLPSDVWEWVSVFAGTFPQDNSNILHKVAHQLSLSHALVRLSTVWCTTTSSSEELCVLVVKFTHSLSTCLLNAFKASGSVLGPGRWESQGIVIVFFKKVPL